MITRRGLFAILAGATVAQPAPAKPIPAPRITAVRGELDMARLLDLMSQPLVAVEFNPPSPAYWARGPYQRITPARALGATP